MIAGLWPTPIADVAAAVIGVIVVWLLKVVWSLQERVSRLEGIEESGSSSSRSEDV
jgi:hypothetical protein